VGIGLGTTIKYRPKCFCVNASAWAPLLSTARSVFA
jgi:hypothetical protein